MNSNLNITDTEETSSLIGSVLKSATFVFIGLLVAFTNVCSLIIIRRQNDVFGEVSRFLYRCTAIVDLIGGLSGCLFFSIFVVRNTWPFDHWSCRILITMFYGAMLQSMIYLTCINIDRYIAIRRPLRYHSIVTLRSVKMVLGLSLIPTSVFCAFNLVPKTSLYKLSNPTCRLLLNETLNMNKTEKVLLSAAYFMVMVPIFIGMTLNLVSMVISVRQARAVADCETAPSLDHERNRPNILSLKGVKTILLISAVNLLAWTPAIVRFNYTVFTGLALPEWLDAILAVLTLVNFWSNAPIFARTNSAYRIIGKALFRPLLCKDIKGASRRPGDGDNVSSYRSQSA